MENSNRYISDMLYYGQLIDIEYGKILSKGVNAQSINYILYLKRLENDTLKKIEFDEKTKRTIKHFFELNTTRTYESLPYGVEREIEPKEYPYYRLMSYMNADYINGNLLKSLNDTVVAFLYQGLYELSDEEAIRKKAFQILLNSPLIEKQILENNLQPLDIVYDTSTLEVGLKSTIMKVKSKKDDDFRNIYQMDVSEEIISEFINRILHLSEYISETYLLESGNKAQLNVIKAYLNSLIATLDEEELDDMRYNTLEILPSPEIQDLVVDGFDEAGKLFQLKRKVSFINFKE